VRSRRLAAVAVVAVSLGAATVLAVVRVRSTEVALDLKADEVTLTLPSDQPALGDALLVASLGAAGLSAVAVPNADGTVNADARVSTVLLTAVRNRRQSGRVTMDLSALALAAGTRVRAGVGSLANEYQLSLTGTLPDVAVLAVGAVHVLAPGAFDRRLSFDRPLPIMLRPDRDGDSSAVVDLDLSFKDTASVRLLHQVPTSGLRLLRVEQFVRPEHTGVREVSTIRSGILRYESLNGKARELRPGEELRFRDSRGEVTELRLAADGVRLLFHGRVAGMRSGPEQRSVMPTLLEYANAATGPGFIVASTVYVAGLAFTVLRWWRKPT